MYIYLRATWYACNTRVYMYARAMSGGGGGRGEEDSLPLRQIYAVIIQRVCFRLLLLAGSIY